MKQKYLLTLVLCLSLCCFSYGQILTFEFSSLAGSEVSATSNTNDPNISSSSITRGSGLNASGNGGRFNATKWSTGDISQAISGEDYMEFTVTPNSNYQFSISSIEVKLQRSATGPGSIAIRNSLDNYASDLDSDQQITDNKSTQGFTFTFSQASSASAVTYRIYLYNAESSSGSGGIGDFSGNDLIINGTVSAASSSPLIGFSSPTSSETETDATFNTNIPVTLANYNSPVTISVFVDNSSTAEAGDYTLNTTSLNFTGAGTQNISLDIKDDADDNDETIVINIDVTSGSADLGTTQHTVTVTDDDLPAIVISEFMYNTPSTDDEWIEVHNTETSAVDISDWQLTYGSNKTFTFPSGMNAMQAGAYLTVAVGSNGDETYNNDNPFTPDYNNLAVANASVADKNSTNKLGNTSGTISLKNAAGGLVDSVSYDKGHASSTDGDGPSYELMLYDQDNASTSNNWQASGFKGGSPGKTNTNIWQGSSSSAWGTEANWSRGIPTASSDVLISNNVSNYPTASNAVSINSATINSGASLIAESTFAGTITYTRTLDTDNWYLITMPVVGQNRSSFIADANLATGTGNNIGLAAYSNVTEAWNYFQSNSIGLGSFGSGPGYAIKRSASGNINFTGTFNDTDVNVNWLSRNTNGFNLIGNPYLAAVSVAELLNENATVLEEQTIWLWDQAQDSYVQKNLAEDLEIAPGQGFFISLKTGENAFDFREAMQSHAADTFQKGASSRPEISLFMNNGTENSIAKILYVDVATTGWDNGYDSSIFEGLENESQLYTQTVENGTDKKLGIQSLPNAAYENGIIPIGLKAAAGKELTFTVNAKNLPEGMMVFLEDRLHNTTTRLDETNSAFKTTLDTDQDGVGRFYLITSSIDQTLSVDDVNLSRAHVFMSANSTLKITGLQSDKAALKMHSILGKTIINTTLKSEASMQFKLPSHIVQGVYIVSITTENGSTTKKIFIQ